MARLLRTDTGYATPDGLWTVEPVVMGDSPRSKGQREWSLRRVDGSLVGGRPSKIFDALWRVRDYLDEVQKEN